MKRRDFMKIVGTAGLGAVGWKAFAQDESGKKTDPKSADGAAPVSSVTNAEGLSMEARPLGKTGFRATLLGFGGYPISEVGEKEALGAIDAALEAGINYFDSASTYGAHKSEQYLGKVLPKVKERGSFFLTTKTLQRKHRQAEKEIAESLKALKIEPDLLQLHALNDMKSLDVAMGKGGSFEAAVAAKEAGHVKYLGITGHTRPDVVIKALERYDFDTVLIPLGAPDHHLNSFEGVIEKANAKGVAVIGMKVLSGGHAVGKMPLESLYEYTWNLPIATAIIGMKNEAEVKSAVAAVRKFKPLTKERVAEILEQAKPLGNSQTLWWKRT